MKTSAFFVLVLPLCLSMTACTPSQTISTGDGKATVTTDGRGGGNVVVEGKDGQKVNVSTGSSAKYPENCPLPQYPGSICTMCMDSTGDQSLPAAGQSITLTTSDPSGKVI